MHPVFDFDATSALSKGQRSTQEDAIIADFARGTGVGVAVLADGMGGHAAGDIASKIVVTEVFSDLMFRRGDLQAFEKTVTEALKEAALAANSCLRDHVQAYPDTRGMGSTLVASVLIGRHLYWISIGDSPLFLFRDGQLRDRTLDHSLVQSLINAGVLTPDQAREHPRRSELQSALLELEMTANDE